MNSFAVTGRGHCLGTTTISSVGTIGAANVAADLQVIFGNVGFGAAGVRGWLVVAVCALGDAQGEGIRAARPQQSAAPVEGEDVKDRSRTVCLDGAQHP